MIWKVVGFHIISIEFHLLGLFGIHRARSALKPSVYIGQHILADPTEYVRASKTPDYCRVFSIKDGGVPALSEVTKSFTTTVHSREADQQNHTHTTMSLQDTTAVHSPEAGQQNRTHTTQDEDRLVCYPICNH